MIHKRWMFFWAIWVVSMPLVAQSPKEQWVDSVFKSMSTNEKIGQLFMVSVSLDDPDQKIDEAESRMKSYGLGGVVFKNGNALRHASFANKWQSESDVPLLIGIDGCSGMRTLTDTLLHFPTATAQGAINNDSLLFELGKEIGHEMKLLGAQLNFIPANLSTDSNADGKSFGEDRFNVADKVVAYWTGLQSAGVVACAKYFPVQVNSAAKDKNPNELALTFDSLQAYPFRKLLLHNLPGMMPAAADLALFEPHKKISFKVLLSGNETEPSFEQVWLRKTTGFDGLLFADMEQMLKHAEKLNTGEAEIFAWKAGNHIIVNSPNIPATVRRLKKVIRKDKDLARLLDQTVRKILAFKYDAGLYQRTPARTENLLPYLTQTSQQLLRTKLYRSAVTVVKNDVALVPVVSLENRKYSCVVADDSVKGKTFFKFISKYVHNDFIAVNEKKDIPNFYNALISKQVIIIGVFPTTKEETIQRLFSALSTKDPEREIIVCDFGSEVFKPYAQHFPTVISAYSDDAEMLKTVPEVIFGGLPANATLPVSFGKIAPGTGIATKKLNRLIYSYPEEAGMDSRTLTKIEEIAKEAIDNQATPGCYVLVAKDGKVVYEKPFGHFTYEKVSKVTDNTIYDLASVTKVMATLQSVMFVYEKGLIDINKKASYYLPELRNSNKKDYTLKDILTHQAGLWPFLPFWAQTMKDSQYLPEYYNDTLSTEYPFVVAEKLYAHKSMRDSLWTWIINSKVREKAARTPYDYKYSDMGFYIMQHLSEKLLNQPIDDFLSQNLYEPLGAYTTGYLPLLRFPISQIAPTENDKLFRKSLLIGMVHDQGAAMHGGVAGHAGLFSDANDLAKVGQMLLQEGEYGGTRYYKPETVRLFAQRQFATSVRGLGWNKPSGTWDGATSMYSSVKTFGHTGFTGTCIWIDPEFNLVYIFLSNRVHPDMTNNKLLNANIRSRIQDVVYQSIFEFCNHSGGEPIIPENLSLNPIGRSQ